MPADHCNSMTRRGIWLQRNIALNARFACGTHVALAIAVVMDAWVAPRTISTMDSSPVGGSV
jgi:hypothetical protein